MKHRSRSGLLGWFVVAWGALRALSLVAGALVVVRRARRRRAGLLTPRERWALYADIELQRQANRRRRGADHAALAP